jgi:hypothetical protein
MQPELPALLFLLEQGACLLQIHPLEEVGRAGDLMADRAPDAIEASFAAISAVGLREAVGDRITVQLYFADADALRDHPGRVFAAECAIDDAQPLSDLVSPLVIEPDGTVVPIVHGFPRRYALGNLHDASLCELSRRWRRHGLPDFLALSRSTFKAVTEPVESPVINWYEKLRRRALLVGKH